MKQITLNFLELWLASVITSFLNRFEEEEEECEVKENKSNEKTRSNPRVNQEEKQLGESSTNSKDKDG